MDKKVKIQVFGIPGEYPSTSGCGCGPAKTMKEMFEDVQVQLMGTDVKDHIDLTFVNVEEEDIQTYEYARKAVENGYGYPLTAIKDRVRFHNSIPASQIYRLVKQQLR